MIVKWLILYSLMHISMSTILYATSGNTNNNYNRQCPDECTCDTDKHGHYYTLCLKGNMKFVPVQSMDNETDIIIISGPRNSLSIGPIFIHFLNLEILRITDSNVPAIGTKSFWGLKNLKILDLSKNNISTVVLDNFRGQNNLIELNLADNKIHRIASGQFYHLTGLQILNLSGNLIENLVDRTFFHVSHLKYLDLSNNPFNDDLSPNVFKDILTLRVLKCRNCNLVKINPQVYNFTQYLRELDIGNNKIKYLEKSDFVDLKHLMKLRIDGNQISVIIDNLFERQKSLEYLDVSRNRLAKITNGAFTNLSNLTYLDISYNKLSKLEVLSVLPLKNLRALNISGNVQIDLHHITNTFQVLHYLKTLYVAEIGSLPKELFVPFTQLKSLNLSGNQLDTISLEILKPVNNLELLDLSRNQLNGFTEAQATTLQKINEVQLENNPLICDRCHMGYLINREISLRWNTFPICFLPVSLRGIPISKLNVDTLYECIENVHDEEHDAASTSHNFLENGNINALAFVGGIIFVLAAAVILISFICLSRHRARYYTNEDKRNGTNEIPFEKNLEPVPITIDKEISFKFPMDDRVCTIDDMMIPPPPPPPPPQPQSSSITPTSRKYHSVSSSAASALLLPKD